MNKYQLQARLSVNLNQQPNHILAEVRTKLIDAGFKPHFDRHLENKTAEFWTNGFFSQRIDIERQSNGVVTKVIVRELSQL